MEQTGGKIFASFLGIEILHFRTFDRGVKLFTVMQVNVTTPVLDFWFYFY